MFFNFFKNKKIQEHKTYEGVFVSDEEIENIKHSNSNSKSFISKEFKEIGELLKELNNYFQ